FYEKAREWVRFLLFTTNIWKHSRIPESFFFSVIWLNVNF
ncbi:MAG: hypothetical protein ACI81T_002748, partial [Bacteroidia bacterium]